MKNYILTILSVVFINNVIFSQETQSYSFEEVNPIQNEMLNRSFKTYKIFTPDIEKISNLAEGSDQFRLNLLLGNQYNWNMYLQLNDMRAENYRSVMTTDRGEEDMISLRSITYKGNLENNENNFIRLNISRDGGMWGYVKQNNVFYFIEPLKNFIKNASPDKHILYKLTDVISNKAYSCSANTVLKEFNKLKAEAPPTNLLPGPGGCLTLELATDADFEYFSSFGNNTNNHIIGILNQVEGIYHNTFQINFTITFQNVYSTNNDPYTTTNAEALLNQFMGFWNTNPNRRFINRDLAHLWTGKDLDGNIIGIACVSVLCSNPNLSYGLSQKINGATNEACLSAHEIGHNFGGFHDDGQGCDGDGSIMCPNVQNALWFAQTEINRISNHISSTDGACMSYCCQTVHVQNPIMVNQYISTTQTLEGSSDILSGAQVTFRSENMVRLTSNFHAQNGSEFRAQNGSCLGNGPIIKTLTPVNTEKRIIQKDSKHLVVYPNPSSGTFKFEYSIDNPALISISIFDMYGQKTAQLIENSESLPGKYSIEYDGSKLSKGCYFYVLKVGNKRETGQIIKL